MLWKREFIPVPIHHQDGNDVTVTAKGMDMKVIQTSVYVSVEFTVEVFGKQYQIPVQEYVYSYRQK